MTTFPHFISYYRVSTRKQSCISRSLEAQRAAVVMHIAGLQGVVTAEFIEMESRGKKDRPQLAAALTVALAYRATLVIAKLGRLARNVHFVTALMESGVEFAAADLPVANRLNVHILVAAAEEESRMISARSKAACAAAKARGVRIGNPLLGAAALTWARTANVVKIRRAQVRAAELQPLIEQAQRAGAHTLQQLADALTAQGVATPSGRGRRWHRMQVARIVNRSRGTAIIAAASPL